MAHAALKNGASKYGPFPYFQIRARLYSGLKTGSMSIGSLLDDEREKILSPSHCAYCGMPTPTTVDHPVPRLRGGGDASENLVPCCSSCNSRKGAQDVMSWYRKREEFPTLSICRRYLKLAVLAAEGAGVMESEWFSADALALPFEIAPVPMNYPEPLRLRWRA
jgi:hypothetical protein